MEKTLLRSEVENLFDNQLSEKALAEYADEVKLFDKKIVVLDDDPTGVQTVHDIPVYTDCSYESIRSGFLEESNMFFILTNSRSFTSEETIKYHTELCRTLAAVSKDTGRDFIILSRSDSTLRGHFPLETETIKNVLEEELSIKFDGELLYPFFPEGERYTLHGIHYIGNADELIPASLTDYSKDKTFPFTTSYLPAYIEEKTGGKYKESSVFHIDLDLLRCENTDALYRRLLCVNNFGKVCADSMNYNDAVLLCTAFMRAARSGKRFMFRVSAGFVKIIGNVSNKPLLKKELLIDKGNSNGGLVVIASHVKKTTEQFDALKKCDKAHFIQFDQHTVLREGEIEKEVERVRAEAEKLISAGKTAIVYTRRDRVDFGSGDKEDELRMATKISDSVTAIVAGLNKRPSFLIAKGGITSSDIGTKALKVKRAVCVGQIKPGIPVWFTGKESKFPDLPYVIFPGNVGKTETLYEIVEELS